MSTPPRTETLAALLEERFGALQEYECPLPYRLIEITGDDRTEFLNRILAQNVPPPGSDHHFAWAALVNPQGRVLALLRVLTLDASILLVVEDELAAGVREILARYVLRSRVSLTVDPRPLAGHCRPRSSPHSREQPSDGLWFGTDAPGVSSHRAIYTVATENRPATARDGWAHWCASDFIAGIPHLLAPSSGQFIPQALNLLALGAVSLRKGCYPGQEIIARTAYRGRAKRALALFETATPTPAGTPLREVSSGTEIGWVLDACHSPSGEIWVQAVIEEGAWESGPAERTLTLPSGTTGTYRLLEAFKAA